MADKPKIGPWTVTHSFTAYDNAWLSLEHHDVIHPDGSAGIYGVVRFHNIAIGVLPVFEDGSVPLVGQHRFPLDTYSWELPEGGGAHDVDPLNSAQRELAEETGFSAENWLALGEADLSNSVTDEKVMTFLAWNLTPGAVRPEASEDLSHDRVSLGELIEKCLSGAIRDALTQLMAFQALAKFERGELPRDLAERIQRGLGRV